MIETYREYEPTLTERALLAGWSKHTQHITASVKDLKAYEAVPCVRPLVTLK